MEVVRAITSQQWLLAGDTYYCSSQVWDSRLSDTFLCDRVLPLVDYVVSSGSLRKMLGWQTLPFDILQRQYLAVLPAITPPSTADMERMTRIIQELTHRFDNKKCTENDLRSLAQALDGKAWVPVSDGHYLSPHRTILQHADLGSCFHQVSHAFVADPRAARFFRAMGIPDRPSHEALYIELDDISFKLEKNDIDGHAKRNLISTSLKILREVFRHESSAPQHLDRSRILIPTSSNVLNPIDSTFFNDLGSDITGDEDIALAHPDISASLAETMGLVRRRTIYPEAYS
ncbi:hypothetical protein FRB94_007229 [Tulasnella sp. JGI-2019a]|nr:hypothetical protein FRB94_007229 [Tulasnella sp. JGI-2019a]KAG9010590.1 hypothetical protein FRB93_003858 [Tulasnella sp. JGI-2019a]